MKDLAGKMTKSRMTMLSILGVSLAAGEVVAGDDPFPLIEQVPQRALIGVDQYGLPRISAENKAQVARLVVELGTPKQLRFYAIWGLATSGFSPEAAEALTKVAEDNKLDKTARDYATMGLGNFTLLLPGEMKEGIRIRLRSIVKAESTTVPDGILRTLVRWGDAPWIAEQFGDRLKGHVMEITILTAARSPKAAGRLFELYEADVKQASSNSYIRRSEIGSALVELGDKRGIDILETLLDARSVPDLGQGSPPNPQYRHNVFREITKAIENDFGYSHLNFDPSIDEAIRKFRGWWTKSRDTFEFKGDSKKIGRE